MIRVGDRVAVRMTAKGRGIAWARGRTGTVVALTRMNRFSRVYDQGAAVRLDGDGNGWNGPVSWLVRVADSSPDEPGSLDTV